MSGDYSGVASSGAYFSPGATTSIVTVATTSDTLDEDSETFSLTLTGGGGYATATINDDDAEPSVSISYADATEGGALTFTVSLSAASGKTITVNYGATGITAESEDFTVPGSGITFEPGVTTATVAFSLYDDSIDEDDEVVAVSISGPSNATLGASIGLGTISDNDMEPSVYVLDNSTTEGESLSFGVSLSAATERSITINFATAPGTAVAADYTARTGTVVVTGSGNVSGVYVDTTPDSSDEDDETFSLSWSASGGASGSGTAVGTITDNDDPPAVNAIGGMTVEGEDAVFTLAPSTVSGKLMSVYYQLVDGEARVVDDDYVSAGVGWVTIPANAANATVSVPTTDDSEDEDDETFSLVITGVSVGVTSATPGVVGQSVGVMTIIDADSYFSIAGGDSVAEPDEEEETTTLEFVITFADPGGNGGSVYWRAAASNPVATGMADQTDFGALDGVAEFSAGGGDVTISVPVLFDMRAEPDETVVVRLSNPSPGSSIADDEGEGVILDTPDESLLTPSIEAETPEAAVNEGGTITLTGMVAVPVGTMPSTVYLFNDDTDEDLGTATVSSSGKFAWSMAVADDNPTTTSFDGLNIRVETTVDSTDIDTVVAFTINNVRPTVDFITKVPLAPSGFIEGHEMAPGDTVEVVINSGDVGVEDDRIIVIDWGDATQNTTISGQTTWPATRQHQYPSAIPLDPDPPQGYTIRVTATDDDGGSTTVQSSLLLSSTDNEVWLEAGDDDASEIDSADTGSFKIHRSGTVSTPLVVGLSRAGAATRPGDFELWVDNQRVSGGIRFEPGDDEVEVILIAKDDGEPDAGETVTYSLTQSTQYTVRQSSPSVTISIEDCENLVGITTTRGSVTEDAGSLAFRIWATTPPTNGLAFDVVTTVWRYQNNALIGSIDKTTTLTPTPSGATGHLVLDMADAIIEPNENIKVTFRESFLPTQYTVSPGHGEATGTIIDDDAFTLTLALSSTSRPEEVSYYNSFNIPSSANRDTITVTRTGSTKYEKRFWLDYSGTATPKHDYGIYSSASQFYLGTSPSYATSMTNGFVIPAGQTSATYYLFMHDDKLLERDEAATFVATSAGVSSNSATITIVDDEDDIELGWTFKNTSTIVQPVAYSDIKDKATGASLGEWAYDADEGSWNRIVKRASWEVPQGASASTRSTSLGAFSAGSGLGFTANQGSNHQFQIGRKFKADISINYTYVMTSTMGTTQSAKWDPDDITMSSTSTESWRSQILIRRIDVFHQKIWGRTSSNPPPTGATADSEVGWEYHIGVNRESTFGATIWKLE